MMKTRLNKRAGRPTKEQDAIRDLGMTVSKQEAEIDELRNIIKERDNAIVGYKAVISYLEFQYGLKESQ
jgi:hypothetical protein